MVVERETIGNFIDACVSNRAEAKRLLNANPELRTACWLGDEPILMFLAIENFADAVRFCIENGFDVNAGNSEFNITPLHNACKLNYPDVVRVLCELGADTNIESEIDGPPLHCCIASPNPDIIDILLKHGADPDYETSLGETIFDNWPNHAKKQVILSEALAVNGITRNP